MKCQGMTGASRAKKSFTTHSDKGAVRTPDLVNRHFSATRPNQLWGIGFQRGVMSASSDQLGLPA